MGKDRAKHQTELHPDGNAAKKVRPGPTRRAQPLGKDFLPLDLSPRHFCTNLVVQARASRWGERKKGCSIRGEEKTDVARLWPGPCEPDPHAPRSPSLFLFLFLLQFMHGMIMAIVMHFSLRDLNCNFKHPAKLWSASLRVEDDLLSHPFQPPTYIPYKSTIAAIYHLNHLP